MFPVRRLFQALIYLADEFSANFYQFPSSYIYPSHRPPPHLSLSFITMAILPAWQVKAQELVAARDAQIPEDLRFKSSDIPHNPSQLYRKLLSPRQVEIVELDATALAAAIAERRYTSVEVTEAFIRSAAGAHGATNCLAWFDVKAARERAKWLDEEIERNGIVGPLHGVPMSVKGKSSYVTTIAKCRLLVYKGIPAEFGTSVYGWIRARRRCRYDGDIQSCGSW